MPRTSDKAQLIMDYVNQFIQENGYSPSVREIGAAVGLRSTASVSYHLQALQEKGLLQSPGAKGRKRALVTGARRGRFQSWVSSRQACPFWRWKIRRAPCPGMTRDALLCGFGATA